MIDHVEVKGATELKRVLGQIPVEFERNISRGALRAGALVIEQEAKALVPVEEGDLRDSIRVTSGVKKAGRVFAHVVAGGLKRGQAWYAHLVEFGTRPHYILADRGSGRDPRSLNTINRAIRKGMLKIGQVFRKAVVHPGAKAKPFMRPAFDNKAQAAVEAISEFIRARLEKFRAKHGGI